MDDGIAWAIGLLISLLALIGLFVYGLFMSTVVAHPVLQYNPLYVLAVSVGMGEADYSLVTVLYGMPTIIARKQLCKFLSSFPLTESALFLVNDPWHYLLGATVG